MNNKKVILIYLGEFFYDARCINMALSLLKSNCSLSVISVDQNILNYAQFQSVKFYPIKTRDRSVFRYWNFHKQAIRYINKNIYDIIISGDLYSLSSACLSNHSGKIIYDCREIYSALSAHKHKPIHRFFCSFYESFFLRFVNIVFTTALSDQIFYKKNILKKHI